MFLFDNCISENLHSRAAIPFAAILAKANPASSPAYKPGIAEICSNAKASMQGKVWTMCKSSFIIGPPLKGLIIRRLEDGWKRVMPETRCSLLAFRSRPTRSRRLCGCSDRPSGSVSIRGRSGNFSTIEKYGHAPASGFILSKPVNRKHRPYYMAGGVIESDNNERF